MIEIVSNTIGEKFFCVPRHFRLDIARNNAVLTALSQGANYIVFIDSDVIPHVYENGELRFFPDVINRMLAWRYPIVSGIYMTTKGHPAVYRYTGGNPPYEPLSYDMIKDKITYADAVGCGIVCVDARVFEKLKDEGYFPWFEYRVDYRFKKKGIEINELSEDIDFFDKCRKCGFKVMILPHIIGVHLHRLRMYPDGRTEVDRL